ncbi:LuxR C-terminal-related transcriptional regulator, partial [Enterobacter roggenkampii]|uniref:LuxR C-terminal-related transcriptional regulator n=1 Tax=Enterobacter roggenkampii TaxID=1812935 RepID=UPI00196675CC
HLTDISSVSFSDLCYINKRANLLILNDTFVHSSVLSRYYNSIAINARMSLSSAKEMIACKYELSCKGGKKNEGIFSSLTNKEVFVLFKSLGGSDIGEISRIMNLSEKSIYGYRKNALKKIGVKKIAHVMCSGFAMDYTNKNL